MSKQTVVDEADATQFETYLGLNYLEFLECIGRLAQVRCIGSEMELTTDLADKIVELLYDMLAVVRVKVAKCN